MFFRSKTSTSPYLDEEGILQIQSNTGPVRIKLDPQLSSIMQVLLSRKNALVKRQEMVSIVWSDNHLVGSSALTRNMWRLRKKLRDHEVEEILRIDTVPKLGYKLICQDRSIGDKRSPILNHWQVMAVAMGVVILAIFMLLYAGTSQEVFIYYR